MKKALLIAVIGMILNSFQVSIETGGTLPVGGGKKVDASSIDL